LILKKKTILIIGAGLGKGTVISLAKARHHVIPGIHKIGAKN